MVLTYLERRLLRRAVTPAVGLAQQDFGRPYRPCPARPCVATWISSRRRPGQNPGSWLSTRLAARLAAITRPLGRRPAP